MTEQNHPISPPPELVQELYGMPQMRTIEAAFRAGADTELEACIEELYRLWDKDHIVTLDDVVKHLRAARRPKPPSLKEQALDELNRIPTHDSACRPVDVDVSILRRAIESIPDPS